MYNILQLFRLVNIDLISKFNFYKLNYLLKIKKIIIFTKLKTNESDFLINFLIISKIFYFWFQQKLIIFYFKRELIKGSRNNLSINIGVTLKKQTWNYFLNYFKNIITVSSYKIDNTLSMHYNNNNILFSFSNLNYILGLNINKYYKYNIRFYILLKLNYQLVNLKFIYEKIFL